MRRSPLTRLLAGSVALAGVAVVLAPMPSGAQVLQTLTVSKAVDGDTDVEEFDFVLQCSTEALFEFTLTEGESIVIEDAVDLGVSFASGIECALVEYVDGEQPDSVVADGLVITPDDDGAPRSARAEAAFPLVAISDLGGATAGWEFTTFEDPSVIGYEAAVTNVYAPDPPASTSSSSSTTSSLATTTSTAPVRTAAVVPRFTG